MPDVQPTLRHIGGSFAPPFTDELLAKYEQQIASLADGPVKDACAKLVPCCKKWWELPESTGGSRPHPVGRGFIVDLDIEHQKALWDDIPWKHELEALSNSRGDGLFDSIQDPDLRNMAFHLLWHAKELELDREPLTNDKL